MAVRKTMISPRNIVQNIRTKGGNCQLNINLDRFEDQFAKAQYELDSDVMTDMIPFMPKETGTFINDTQAMSQAIAGNGQVYAAAPPYGRFLYKGKVMVDERTGSPWARKGTKKILVSQFTGKTNARENIEFSKEHHQKATYEWFEEAKKINKYKWINKARRNAGGG